MRFTGTSSFLPESVLGMAGTEYTRSGTCRGDRLERISASSRPRKLFPPPPPPPPPDRPGLVAAQRLPRGQDHEQQQLSGAAVGVVQVHHQAVHHLGQ